MMTPTKKNCVHWKRQQPEPMQDYVMEESGGSSRRLRQLEAAGGQSYGRRQLGA